MAATTAYEVELTKDHAVPVGQDGYQAYVTLMAGDIVYYGGPQVSPSFNNGLLSSPGAATQLGSPPISYLFSPSQSSVKVTLFPNQASVASGVTRSSKFDGVSDDTPALNNDQEPASTMWLPVGTGKVASGPMRFGQSSQTIRGEGMFSTVLQAGSPTNAIMSQLSSSGYASQVYVEDLTFDGQNLTSPLNQLIQALGPNIGRLTFRRCRFINYAGLMFLGGHAAEFVFEDCVADGAGTGKGTFISCSNRTSELMIIRRCKFRYLNSVLQLGATGFHHGHVEIDDNDIDFGWWLTLAKGSGSGGNVSYTATVLTDTGASFSGLAAGDYVRVMPVKQTGTFTTATGTYLIDTNATFVTNNVLRGEIVRSGTSFAVVSSVIDNTHLHVEEWLDQTTYQPVFPPATNAAYTVYGVNLGAIVSSTSTTITVKNTPAASGGGFHDLTGLAVTPAAGTLYELLPTRSINPIYVDKTVDSAVLITNNRVRRGGSDNIEFFGSRGVIANNISEDSEDTGIYVGPGSGTSVQANVGPNICRHNGLVGLGVQNITNVEIGPQILEDNGWNSAPAQGSAQLVIISSVRVKVHGGTASVSAESAGNAGFYGIRLSGASTAGCKIMGFTGQGNVSGDIRIESTVAAGANEILDCAGVISYGGTTNGQFTRYKGTGTPLSVLPASPGSQFNRTDGGAGTSFYVKESANDNTGWVGK